MTDEPIVIGDGFMRLEARNGSEGQYWIAMQDDYYLEPPALPWSDWLLLAKAICERERLIVHDKNYWPCEPMNAEQVARRDARMTP